MAHVKVERDRRDRGAEPVPVRVLVAEGVSRHEARRLLRKIARTFKRPEDDVEALPE